MRLPLADGEGLSVAEESGERVGGSVDEKDGETLPERVDEVEAVVVALVDVVPEGETTGDGEEDRQSDTELLALCDVEPVIECEGEFEAVVVPDETREGVSGCVVPTADTVKPREPLTEAVVEGEVLATSEDDTVPERQSVWLPVGDIDAELEMEMVAQSDGVTDSVLLEDSDGDEETHADADADWHCDGVVVVDTLPVADERIDDVAARLAFGDVLGEVESELLRVTKADIVAARLAVGQLLGEVDSEPLKDFTAEGEAKLVVGAAEEEPQTEGEVDLQGVPDRVTDAEDDGEFDSDGAPETVAMSVVGAADSEPLTDAL